MPDPSNADIMQAIGRLDEKVEGVDVRLKYTNGKVAMLVEDKIRRDERVKVTSELTQQATVHTDKGDVIVQTSTARKLDAQAKFWLALASVATAAAIALGTWAGVRG